MSALWHLRNAGVVSPSPEAFKDVLKQRGQLERYAGLHHHRGLNACRSKSWVEAHPSHRLTETGLQFCREQFGSPSDEEEQQQQQVG